MTAAPAFVPGRDWTPWPGHTPSAERKVQWNEGGRLVTGWAMGRLWVVPDRLNPRLCKPPALWRYA